MRFPKYWARGRDGAFGVWRWSDVSVEEARQAAKEAARKVAERFRAGRVEPQHYGYSDRPLREPVLERLGEAAVITRNSYGCRVLNTSRAMFVDIDLPDLAPVEAPLSVWDRMRGLRPAVVTPPLPSSALAAAERWAESHSNWSWRVYRTHSGLRLLATHDLFDPAAAACQDAFAALDADPLYRKLCHNQECFRARLTPKPWRMNDAEQSLHRLRMPWPFEHESQAMHFEKLVQKYERAATHYATCQLVRTIGSGQVHQEIQPLVELHDRETKVSSNLPLA